MFTFTFKKLAASVMLKSLHVKNYNFELYQKEILNWNKLPTEGRCSVIVKSVVRYSVMSDYPSSLNYTHFNIIHSFPGASTTIIILTERE